MATAKAVLESAVKAWNSDDEGGVLSLGSKDIELTAPGGMDFHGLDGLRTWYRLWTEACPDRRIRYTNVVGDQDQVIGEGTFTGTHTGVLHLPTGDVPPTGRQITADFAAVIKVSDDRITYMRHYMDVMDLMIKLGLVPAPAPATA